MTAAARGTEARRVAWPLDTLEFVPLDRTHFALLHEWLRRPHVGAWWQPTPTRAEVDADFGAMIEPGSTTRGYIVLLDGQSIGFIQSYVVQGSGDGWWEDETDPGARGIDQFLANVEHLGRGLGSAIAFRFVARLFSDPAVTKVQTDPSPQNERAIRSYARAGFRAQRIVDTPDGPALLMLCRRDDLARAD